LTLGFVDRNNVQQVTGFRFQLLLLRQDFAVLLMRQLRDVEDEVGPDP
jgi:hypothetical protein